MVIHNRHPAHLKYPKANQRPSLIKNFLDVQIIKMHVSGSAENFKYFFALVLKLLMKNISNLLVRLFVISLLTFRYFSVIVSLFGAGAATIFTAPAPAPAPTKMCRLRRLRLRLRLRLRIPGLCESESVLTSKPEARPVATRITSSTGMGWICCERMNCNQRLICWTVHIAQFFKAF